jgi:predicted PurR-regulated permease PerM
LTLYILSRGSYFQLAYHYKWKKGLAAGFFLFVYLILLILIFYIIAILLSPKISRFLNSPEIMLQQANDAILQIQKETGVTFFSENTFSDLLNRLSSSIPKLLNNTSILILNLAIMLFILYYMLVHGKEMEKYLKQILPLKQRNIYVLASETKRIIKASALGIPLISSIQGLTATLGYFIFGVDEFILWGFITGVFAFFPVVGTMIIWIPLVIYTYATGDTWNATGLFFFSLIVTGNVDYLTRITIMKNMGHIHPVITVLGVLMGLSLFGFIGLIFGPLLVNYIILLFRIYMNEFVENKSEVEN